MRKPIRNRFLAPAVTCAFALGLSACTFRPHDYDVADRATGASGLPEVESLGETIAREQRGSGGCLVAGNLDEGGRCEKLRGTLFPPAPPTDPKL